MCYESIGLGLGIGRHSKSNDSESDRGQKILIGTSLLKRTPVVLSIGTYLDLQTVSTNISKEWVSQELSDLQVNCDWMTPEQRIHW